MKGKSAVTATTVSNHCFGSSYGLYDGSFTRKYIHYSVNCTKIFANGSWIIDTEATDHMASNRSTLTSAVNLYSPIDIHNMDGFRTGHSSQQIWVNPISGRVKCNVMQNS